MQRERIKGIVIGVVMMILFSFILNPSLAKSIQESISVTYSDIKIVIDGIKIDPKDADGRTVEPFIYNGTTYLPVRAISESLGKQVGWDQDTKTVYIGLVPEKGNTMKYTNARFGFSVDYPQHWGEITESQNGDGAVLFQNDMMDVRAHADYSLLALNLSFDDYINEYYYGWERNNAVVLGADKAVKLIYHGEDSYQTALLAEKDGVVYTFAVVRMKYYSPEQIDGSLETIITETETAEKTFKIL